MFLYVFFTSILRDVGLKSLRIIIWLLKAIWQSVVNRCSIQRTEFVLHPLLVLLLLHEHLKVGRIRGNNIQARLLTQPSAIVAALEIIGITPDEKEHSLLQKCSKFNHAKTTCIHHRWTEGTSSLRDRSAIAESSRDKVQPVKTFIYHLHSMCGSITLANLNLQYFSTSRLSSYDPNPRVIPQSRKTPPFPLLQLYVQYSSKSFTALSVWATVLNFQSGKRGHSFHPNPFFAFFCK